MDTSTNTNQTLETSKACRIKVCGMTDIDQLHQIGEMGVQFAGMIFYPKSPRYVLKHLHGEDVKKEKLKVFKIGVFVNATYDEVMKQVDAFGLDMVQLHGDETPYSCSKLSDYISVIKAFRIIDNDHVEWKIKDYYADTDMFMFDTEGSGYGGTGRKFNWGRLKGLDLNKPFFLSGGIEPGDEQNLKKFFKEPVAKDLFSIDINSKFELAPGVKDMNKVREFVTNMQQE